MCKFKDSHVFEEILDKHIDIANNLASGPDQNETNSSGGLWKQNNGAIVLKLLKK